MRDPEHSDCGCPGAGSHSGTRREFLRSSSCGFGMFALAGLMADRAYAEQSALQLIPRLQAKAKHVIFLFMDGGPSHVDTFDYKPALARYQGQPIGEGAVSKKSQSNAGRRWLGSPWAFQQRGQSGLWVSDLFPEIAKCADDICVVRSLVGIQPLHGQQNLLLHTGRIIGQAPSLGSWVSYGLGSENQDLPGYVLLNNDWIPNGGFENFSSAFLPANHAATMIRADGTPVDNIVSPDSNAVQLRKLDLLREQDGDFAQTNAGSTAVEAAIKNYEIAFRMQTAVPDVVSIAEEDSRTIEQYGINSDDDYRRFYGLQCLRARRLVEAGVRFIEVTCPLTHANNSPWDQHSKLVKYHTENALITEQAIATLIQDLKQRGLLDETIVMWAGEMGRTPHTASTKINESTGRDHHVNGYSIFLAGGGSREAWLTARPMSLATR